MSVGDMGLRDGKQGMCWWSRDSPFPCLDPSHCHCHCHCRRRRCFLRLDRERSYRGKKVGLGVG